MQIENKKKSANGKSYRAWRYLGFALAAAALIAAGFFLPVSDWIAFLQTWVNRFGAWGPVVFAFIYIIAVVVLVPGSVLTISAGLAYGLWGLPISLIAATIGASIAFLIARYLARDKVRGFVEGRRRLHAVEQAVSEGGWKIIGLLRLSPLVPFNLQNYVLGVTSVSFWEYVAATFVCMIPGALVNIYIGMIGGLASNDANISNLQWGMFAAGLLASIALAWIVTRKAKAKLSKAGVE
jgi:uncharacterized membrane protein YdjX (TVP38/TMEM64 family)